MSDPTSVSKEMTEALLRENPISREMSRAFDEFFGRPNPDPAPSPTQHNHP